MHFSLIFDLYSSIRCIRVRLETFIRHAKEITRSYDKVSFFLLCVSITNILTRTLGPGADIILGRLSFDPSIIIGQMTAEQIDEVAIKFDQWPLRPRVLFEDASVFL